MNEENQTTVADFLLLGFNDLYSFRDVLFICLFLIYLATVSGNLMIIVLVTFSPRLDSPMYFFLGHLSCCDLLLTTVIVPLMLDSILTEVTISFVGCFAQFYLFGSLATTECYILSVMSYDRYLAICDPLHYSSAMNLKRCFHLAFWCWVLAFLLMLLTAVQVGRLKFCGPNVIDHFFCDLAPLLQLSCSDTAFVEAENLVVGVPSTFLPLLYITKTYMSIFCAILKIPSAIGKKKAFYTCSSHLTVVCIYYGTLIVAYLFLSKSHSLNLNKVLSLLYTVLTPLLNPLIYSLRNKEIKKALSKFLIGFN
ncbi:olfactory receptor 6N1-like [Xenopus tropicalis]|uniref:Olfactory receptor n=1 Tax=Xenopus tropicalis TaxID=8364 RepID=A0A6I8Q606_XENTR|nr:olfactory receptor 6N1-like [Xenopus tropicalis]